ncbi:N-acetylglucosamine-6-phosphate deacetylase [Cohnella soli]|uniref:N-acetylglucosamine-6-phosphate deacetylase n=1 Tax=Cohnella soli TaxID=425005 RepID=A0ABW0HSP7_9BACL
MHNGKILTEREGIIESGTIAWRGEHIAYVGKDANFPDEQFQDGHSLVRIDANGGWVVPGFIDVHVHGGDGRDFMEANDESFDAITRFHRRHGTTGLLATTVTASPEAIKRVVRFAKSYQNKDTHNAELLGVHLEGPFISPAQSGAQDPRYIVLPRRDWLEGWTREHPNTIRMLTLAPELDGAHSLIGWLNEHGIVAACGHTNASYDQIIEATEQGLCHAVHTFNAMKGIHHREPGTVGAILDDARISAEIIADGHHVHPACIRLLAKLKGPDRFILVTDAIAATGMADGEYHLAGHDVVVKDAVSRLKHGGNLAGSTLTMIDACRYMIETVGLDIGQVSRYASGNPARLLGLERWMGSLEEGKLANVLLLSPQLELQTVWVRGKNI